MVSNEAGLSAKGKMCVPWLATKEPFKWLGRCRRHRRVVAVLVRVRWAGKRLGT